MRRLNAPLLSSFFLLSAALTQLAVGARSANTLNVQAAENSPVILYANWIGKTLEVQGRNFAEGATILVDGQRLRTAGFDNASSYDIFAKKAKNKVARNQAITLQVQNPNGETSDPFAFHSGFVVTMHDFGSLIHLNVGDRFLLFLPPQGDPPTVGWTVDLLGTDQTILKRSMEDLPIPHSQGFFEAVRAGLVTVDAQGSPLCPPLPPEYCGPRGFFMGFNVGVVVE